MELRYYKMPEGSPILALLGQKWVQNYGNDIDYLHFHNYLEIGFCYEGQGFMILGEDKVQFHDREFTVIPSNYPHTTNSDIGTISRWEYLFIDVEGFLDKFINNSVKKEKIVQRINSRSLFLNEKENRSMAGKILKILDIMRDGEEFYLEEVIDNLYKEEIYTILSTPSGARPKWMADKYEEVLRMDPDRTRRFFGGRHNHCYTSQVYREKVYNINKKLSERFGKHPAVLLWHISNEYGGECHCPLCREKFREWLKEKYETIENLNSRWCTTFWSHTYNSFDQIESPSPKGENALHALTLDWERFVTDRTVDFMKHEISAIRAGGSELPATANLMYDYNGLDYKKFKDVMDIASWDNYPSWNKKDNYTTALDGAMQHDLMRSIKKAPFLLMESCPSATNWNPINKLKEPGIHLAASLQAVAHGSDSVLYFQLRQSQGASEKFHGAVIDYYGGDDTRIFREVTEVGEALEQIRETAGSVTKSPVAVLYDRENDWALKDAQGPRNEDMHYQENVLKQYRALRRKGYNTDIINMEHDLSRYRLVTAPMAYMFYHGYAEKLRAFAKKRWYFGNFLLVRTCR